MRLRCNPISGKERSLVRLIRGLPLVMQTFTNPNYRTKERIFEIVNLESLLFGVWAEEEEKEKQRRKARERVGLVGVKVANKLLQARPIDTEQVKPSVIARHCLPISVTSIYRSRYIANPLVSFSISHR